MKTAAEMMDEFSPLGVLLNAVSLVAEEIDRKEDPTENEKYSWKLLKSTTNGRDDGWNQQSRLER